MNTVLENALGTISLKLTTSSAISQQGSRSVANEIFWRLYLDGEPLVEEEIRAWALDRGWSSMDAQELGFLAWQISQGHIPPTVVERR